MKASELRIGNYVVQPSTPFDPVRVTLSALQYYGNDLIPIPITEEWLLKFGFEKDGNYFDIDVNGYSLSIFNLQEYSVSENKDDETNAWFSINYVRQLQNLYSALTNKELTL